MSDHEDHDHLDSAEVSPKDFSEDLPEHFAGRPEKATRKLSITPEMLLLIWSHDWNWEQNGNHVALTHPNGWVLSLGKFREVPATIPTIEDARVRMSISVESGIIKDQVVSSFIRTVFDIDLDDCRLNQLFPLLHWLENHTAEKWIDDMWKLANQVVETR